MEEDAQALRDAAHVHSGEADEDAQKPRDEQHEVCLLYTSIMGEEDSN